LQSLAALLAPTYPSMLAYQRFSKGNHMLTLDSIIQRDPEVIAADADKDLIMVSIATGYYYGISNVAREIWDAIESPKKVSDLIHDLTSSYQIDRPSCEGQTLSFLKALLDEGLVQVKDGPAA